MKKHRARFHPFYLMLVGFCLFIGIAGAFEGNWIAAFGGLAVLLFFILLPEDFFDPEDTDGES